MQVFHRLQENIDEHNILINKLSLIQNEIFAAARIIIRAQTQGRKLIIAGNGGSMADAQHFVAELVNCFYSHDRKAMNAIALGTNAAVTSAWGNDKMFEGQFARELEGIGNKGDVLFLITTSGNSENLVNAAQLAREKGIFVIGLLGTGGGKLKAFCDISIIVPGSSVARVQEAHLLIYHTLSQILEEEIQRC